MKQRYSIQISRRIRMIEKSRSLPHKRILFLLLLPMAVTLLMSFSYLEHQAIKTTSDEELKVGEISWMGNTLYTESQLNERLGINRGDKYTAGLVEEKIWGMDAESSEDTPSSLYLDNGYLFFHAELIESPQDDGFVDLTITIHEGIQAYINEITIEGNGIVPERKILKKISVKQGELFSKSKLINSVGGIAEMKQFDPDKIEVTPTPIRNPESGDYTLVDIEFKLTEKQ